MTLAEDPKDSDQAYSQVANVFNNLAKDGKPGQREDQQLLANSHSDDYYDPAVDPVEGGNFAIFVRGIEMIREWTGNNRVLVAACGDGLETTRLLRLGFDVTAFDISENMVEATRREARQYGYEPTLYVDNLTALQMDRYPPIYAGVAFAQAATFIPRVDNDIHLRRAFTDLASRVPEGVFYFSNTKYDADIYLRTWANNAGVTPLYKRSQQEVIEMINNAGLDVFHTCHFRSGRTPDSYLNDYIVAAPPRVADRLVAEDIVHSTGLPPLETIKGVSALEPVALDLGKSSGLEF